MAMSRVFPTATLALLIAAGGLAGPAWGNGATELKLAQATSHGTEQLDAAKVKQLDAEFERLYKAGKYSEAVSIAERSLAWREANLGPEHPKVATSLNNLAGTYAAQAWYVKAKAEAEALYDKAEPMFLKAISIREKSLGPEHPDTLASLSNLGFLYSQRGKNANAEPLLRRSLEILEKLQKPRQYHRLITAKVIEALAEIYKEQGLFTKAEVLYRRSTKINEEELGSEHPDTALSLSRLADLYAGRFKDPSLAAKAEQLYMRALTVYRNLLPPDPDSIGLILNNLGLLFDNLGFYAKAEPLYQQALAIFKKTRGLQHQSTAMAINNLAVVFARQGNYAKAEPLYQEALAMFVKTRGQEHKDIVLVLNNLSELYENQGFHSQAEPLARSGVAIETSLIQREAPYLPIDDRQSFLQSFGANYEKAFSSAKRGGSGANLALFSRLNRHGLLQEIEQRQAQLTSLPGPQQALANELRAVTQQLASMALTPEHRQQLKGRQEDLEKQLYRLLPQLQPRVVEVQQVAAALPAGSALIEFQRYKPFDGRKPYDDWGEARYLALVLKPDGDITPIDLGLAKPIDALIQSALETSEQKQADALELWAQVGRLVLDPLTAATRGVSTLFLSPDGELNRVPFAALPAPGSSQLLSEALKLRLLTTGRELLDLQNAPNTKTSPALVVANPAFDRTPVSVQSPRLAISSQQRSGDLGSRRWALLPGTATEGAAIAQLTGGRLLAGEQARAATIQQQQAPRLLHLATHAYFQPDLPEAERNKDPQQQRSKNQGPAALSEENPLLRSGIVLAGANQPEADPSDDGYLSALEVARLNWKGTELVVISACESGKGDIQAGEGVYGLKRAIAVAGARSSLLSFWKVDDKATAAFMKSFYSKLKGGLGRADALTATQQEFRQSSNATWSHPYVWAAFQLSGDWGAVKW